MKAIEGMQNKEYDLAIVDPPYGIGMMDSHNKSRTKLATPKDYKKIDDTKPPDPLFFDLLQRKSKNQIIFGANHFIDNFPFMVNSSCWIVWDKDNFGSPFADFEMAWTSFNTAARMFKFTWNGMLQGNMKTKEQRIHPTQKPVQLYKWLLKNYAKPGDKILDTHGGSMSIALACHDMKYDLDLYELDKDYYKAGVKRYNQHIRQLQLF